MLGGFFAEHLHWSVIFWINLPLGLVAFVIAYREPEEACRATSGRTGSTCSGAALLVAATVRSAARA